MYAIYGLFESYFGTNTALPYNFYMHDDRNGKALRQIAVLLDRCRGPRFKIPSNTCPLVIGTACYTSGIIVGPMLARSRLETFYAWVCHESSLRQSLRSIFN